MAYELRGAETFLYARLTAAGGPVALSPAGARVYGAQEAPQGAATPMVLFFWQAGGPVNTMGTPHRVMGNFLFTVKGVVAGVNKAQASAVAEAIDLALQGKSGMVADPAVFVHPIAQEMTVDYLEVNAQTGARYTHRGGVYRVYVNER